jgi:hypothetical protein
MRRGLIALLCLAFALRIAGLGHSLPYKYVADTHVVRGALGMAQEKTLAPAPNKYTSYPYLLPMLLLPQYGTLYAGGKVLGVYRDAQDFGNRMIDDPTPLYWIARLLTTVLGVLAVIGTHRIVRRALGKHRGRDALLAAFFVATSLMLIHLGKDTRPWIAITAFTVFAADRTLSWLRAVTSGDGAAHWKRAFAMGACAGLAFASHQAGGLAVLLPAAAVLVRLRVTPRVAIVGGVVSALAFGGVSLLLGYPYLLVGHSGDVAVEAGEGTAGQFDLGGQSMRTEAFGAARLAETAIGFFGFEPALILFAFAGIFALRHVRFRPGALATVALHPLAVVVLFHFYGGTHTRYLSPAIPLLAVFAALGARAALARGGWVRAVALGLLALPVVQALRLDYVMSRTDTRTEFLATVARHAPEGATIAVEGYGPPLRFAASAVERLASFDQGVSRVEQREAALEAPVDATRPPYSVVPLERFYEFQSAWPHQWLYRGDDPAHPIEKPIERFLDEVGAKFLVMVDRWPGGPRNSALDEIVARRGAVVASLTPYDGAAPREALLPMDPEFAATAIWKVNRPGPELKLVQLR